MNRPIAGPMDASAFLSALAMSLEASGRLGQAQALREVRAMILRPTVNAAEWHVPTDVLLAAVVAMERETGPLSSGISGMREAAAVLFKALDSHLKDGGA